MKLALWKDRREASIEAIRKSMHSLEGHRRTTTTIEFEVEQGDDDEIGDVGELMKKTSKSEARRLTGHEIRGWLPFPEIVNDAMCSGPFYTLKGRPTLPYAFCSVKMDSAVVTKMQKRESAIIRISFKTSVPKDEPETRHDVAICWPNIMPWSSWGPSRSFPRLNKLYLVSKEEMEHRRLAQMELKALENVTREQLDQSWKARDDRLLNLVQEGLATCTFDVDANINIYNVPFNVYP